MYSGYAETTYTEEISFQSIVYYSGRIFIENKVVLKSGPFEVFVSCTYIIVISSSQQLVYSLGLLFLTRFSNKCYTIRDIQYK